MALVFTQVKDGVEYVMWWRVNKYWTEFGFSTEVQKENFISKNMADDEILPTIRKHDFYGTELTIDKIIADSD